MRLILALVAALAVASLTPAAARAAPAAARAAHLDGLWDATVRVKDTDIPFRLQLTTRGGQVSATYFDGERPVKASRGGSFDGHRLRVEFPSYASRLDAQLAGGALRGTIGALPFTARRHTPPAPSRERPPSIAGVWVIPLETPKGEKAWRLIVRQTGAVAYASILRIDGDTGTLDGRYAGGAFRLSRFAGERPASLTAVPAADGSLDLVLVDGSGRRQFRAVREAQARASGLAAPSDPRRHTTVRDPAEPFRFAGVDLSGRTVTQADPRYRGKVVLVNLMGSWCPNCHDEAPFLAELDAKYRARGLRVVGLDFETGEELRTLNRLRAFVNRYGLRYDILVAGDRAEVNAKLPQAVNLNAWPTSFFLDRKGRVRFVHVGFPSRGSGRFEREAREEIRREIESLLAEASPAAGGR